MLELEHLRSFGLTILPGKDCIEVVATDSKGNRYVLSRHSDIDNARKSFRMRMEKINDVVDNYLLKVYSEIGEEDGAL